MQSGCLCVLISIWVGPLGRFRPSSGIFADCSGAVLLLWIFCVFVLSCVCCLCARLFVCALWSPAGGGGGVGAGLLALVCGVCCGFVTFPLVSWVRCGTLLYRFLIFAPLLTLVSFVTYNMSQLALWLSGRVLDSRPKGRGFEPHRRHCVMVLKQDTFILA